MIAARSNVLGAGASNNKVKYSRLAADDDGYIDLQFKKSPPKVPYKAIALAIFLFLIGSLLIIFGALLLSGTIEVQDYNKIIAFTTTHASDNTKGQGSDPVHKAAIWWYKKALHLAWKQPVPPLLVHSERTIPVIIIGLLVFLPGFYHLRIAYFAAKGYRGYSYDDIPDFGD